MKKLSLLSLMMVFVIVSAANAVITIGVYESDGVTEYNGRALSIGETLEFKIIAINGDTQDYAGFALISDTTLGSVGFTGTTNIPPAPDASGLLGDAVSNGVGGLGANDNGIIGNIASFTESPPHADGVYFEDIIFTCNGSEDVTVFLYDIGTTWNIADGVIESVVIHQPEPMTMCLLGIGGLFLRRRK